MKRKYIIALLGAFLTAIPALADGVNWTCDPYAYQYDMTVYAALEIGGKAAVPANYTLAAFCGTECRGVATVETVADTENSYYYLRVRSNVAEGEKITFKCFDTASQKEIALENTIDFSSQARLGYPSDPVLMKAVPDESIKGDVNGDGSINIQDIVVTVEFAAKGAYNAAADMNGDGAVNIQDVVVMVNLSLK